MLNLTYTVPQGILATWGRHRLPRRPFDLGAWGYAVNVFSALWLIVSGTRVTLDPYWTAFILEVIMVYYQYNFWSNEQDLYTDCSDHSPPLQQKE